MSGIIYRPRKRRRWPTWAETVAARRAAGLEPVVVLPSNVQPHPADCKCEQGRERLGAYSPCRPACIACAEGRCAECQHHDFDRASA